MDALLSFVSAAFPTVPPETVLAVGSVAVSTWSILYIRVSRFFDRVSECLERIESNGFPVNIVGRDKGNGKHN